MKVSTRVILPLLGVVFMLGSALLAHLVISRAPLSPALREAFTRGLIPAQAGVVVTFAANRLLPPRHRRLIIVLATLVVSLACYRLSAGLVISTGVLHGLANGLLLLLFGASLRPGAQPTITLLASRIHGDLKADIARYTRQVTVLWCGFFGLQVVVSGALLLFAPLAWWSTFVNLCNLPLVALFFFGEHVFRRWWLRDAPRERLADFLRMGKLIGAGQANAGEQLPPASSGP